MLADGLPEEGESVLAMREGGLVLRECKPPLGKERFDGWPDVLHQQPCGFACDDAVIGITHDVDARSTGHCIADDPLQAVERQICKAGTDYTSNKVAQSLLEFSTSIPRTQLRPSYGEGFLGAPIQIGVRQKAPTPPAQGDARGSSKSSPPSNPGNAHHV